MRISLSVFVLLMRYLLSLCMSMLVRGSFSALYEERGIRDSFGPHSIWSNV